MCLHRGSLAEITAEIALSCPKSLLLRLQYVRLFVAIASSDEMKFELQCHFALVVVDFQIGQGRSPVSGTPAFHKVSLLPSLRFVAIFWDIGIAEERLGLLVVFPRHDCNLGGWLVIGSRLQFGAILVSKDGLKFFWSPWRCLFDEGIVGRGTVIGC